MIYYAKLRQIFSILILFLIFTLYIKISIIRYIKLDLVITFKIDYNYYFKRII